MMGDVIDFCPRERKRALGRRIAELEQQQVAENVMRKLERTRQAEEERRRRRSRTWPSILNPDGGDAA